MAATSVGKIERAHQMYRDGQHEEALGFYTEALSMAKTKPQRIALHSNRAACYLKLHDFKKAAEECTSVLELDHQHAGALMLRAQTLVTMKEYQSALFDVNRLMELNPSSDVYRNLQARLRTQLSLAPIPESEEELLVLEEDDEAEEKEDKDEEKETEEDKNEEQQKIVIQDVVKKIESPKKTNVRVIELCNAKEDVARKFEHINKPESAVLRKLNGEDSVVKKIEFNKPKDPVIQGQNVEDSAAAHPTGWGAIPKPKGHSGLDYSRWDQVEDDSSEDEEDEEEEQQPCYRFRVRTVGVRPVK